MAKVSWSLAMVGGQPSRNLLVETGMPTSSATCFLGLLSASTGAHSSGCVADTKASFTQDFHMG